jgi:hypothetical protein
MTLSRVNWPPLMIRAVELAAQDARAHPPGTLSRHCRDSRRYRPSCAEIIAKKMWHRGDHARAREMYDLCAVADAEPAAIEDATPFLAKHCAAILVELQERAELVDAEFDAIDGIGFRRSFVARLAQARDIIEPLLLMHLGDQHRTQEGS